MKPVLDISVDELTAPVAESAPARNAAATVDGPSRWADYYELTKPRMNFLVIITTMVGFMMARPAGTAIEWALLVHALLGTALCAACAAVLNQVIEVERDTKMLRTQNRPLPAKRIRLSEAIVIGVCCGITGVGYLALMVNVLTALLGLLTIVWYLVVYTPAKRFTTLNTVMGAVPGAIPPMMGFTAATGALSPGAIALFGILFLWQMPHFLAIAVMYRDDYRRGGFKMLPCVEDDTLRITGRMSVLYSIALIPASLLPVTVGLAGAAYFTAAVLLGLAFLSFAVSSAMTSTRADARKLFFASIIYLPVLMTAMMLDKA